MGYKVNRSLSDEPAEETNEVYDFVMQGLGQSMTRLYELDLTGKKLFEVRMLIRQIEKLEKVSRDLDRCLSGFFKRD